MVAVKPPFQYFCWFAAVVLQKMGASSVVATDLEPNLPLLRENCDTNGMNWWCEGVWLPHTCVWGRVWELHGISAPNPHAPMSQ